MVHVMKVYLQELNEVKQIRRLAVNSDIFLKFDLILWKIQELFPTLGSRQIEVTWIDPENDIIHMSSDGELAQAVENSENGLLKLYIYASNDSETIPNAKYTHNDLHSDVFCDGCDKRIGGYRYKCLECEDFDLCSDCNASNKHPDHPMLKILKPTHTSRECAFLGSPKMCQPTFSRRSSSYKYQCQQVPMSTVPTQQQKQEYHSPPPQHAKWECDKSKCHKAVDDHLQDDFIPAWKLFSEDLHNLKNLIEPVTLDDYVKMEKSQIQPGMQHAKWECDKSKCHKAVDDHLKDDFVPAEKLFRENLDNFKNLREPVTLDNYVKMEKLPIQAGFRPKNLGATADVNNATEKSSSSSKQRAYTPGNYAVQTTKKVDIITRSTNDDANFNYTAPKWERAETKKIVPVEMFPYCKTVANAEGWTLPDKHSAETERKNSFTATKLGNSKALTLVKRSKPGALTLANSAKPEALTLVKASKSVPVILVERDKPIPLKPPPPIPLTYQ